MQILQEQKSALPPTHKTVDILFGIRVKLEFNA
jgi:hypothetical protein